MARMRSFGWLLLTSFAACGTPAGGGGAVDAQADASDAALTGDTAPADADAIAADSTDAQATDAVADSAGDGDAAAADAVDAGDVVAACQVLAQQMAGLCATDTTRTCMWNAYAQLCKTGKAQLLLDSMHCFDQTTCRTFSDPNEAQACLVSVHTAGESDTQKAGIQALCVACSWGSCDASTGTAEIIPYVDDADFTAIQACLPHDCAQASTCANVAGIQLFSTCMTL